MESPNVCPTIPSCPAASAPRRSPTNFGNESLYRSLPNVICQAQVLARCDTPARPMTRVKPQPSLTRLCQRLAGPACRTRWASNPALPKIARKRSAGRTAGDILSMDQPFEDWALAEVAFKDAFRVSESFGRVDVLPATVANVKGFQFALLAQPAHAIRQ